MAYDVVVVGAGPAGSSTAFYLAQLGYHVLIVDKRQLPRDKPCGDGLTPRALVQLRNMGLSGAIESFTRIECVRVVEHRSGARWMFELGDGNGASRFGAVVRRHDLDHALCRAAIAAGAHFLPNVKVNLLQPRVNGSAAVVRGRVAHEDFHAAGRFIVLAHGASPLRGSPSFASMRPRAGIAMRQYFHGTFAQPAAFEVHVPLTVDDLPVAGYGWIFPVREGLLNVGVGVCHGSGIPPSVARLRAGYSEFLDRVPELRQCVPCSELTGAPLRVGLLPEDTVAPGVVSVGDAAGLMNPFTGEGISYALESGELAAQAIHAALANGHAEARSYPALLRARYHRQSRLCQELPALYGLARLYDWGRGRGVVSRSGVIERSLHKILCDEPPRAGGTLRSILFEADKLPPCVRDAVDSVDRQVVDEIATVSEFLGEIALGSREDDTMLPGYFATLILAAAEWGGVLDKEAVWIAAAWELFATAVHSHAEVGELSRSAVEPAAGGGVAAILLGDAMIARIFAVLNRCSRTVANRINRALLRQSEALVLATLRPMRRAPRSDLPARLALFSELPSIIAVTLGREDEADERSEVARRWSESICNAAEIAHGVWIDFCVDPSSRSGALYLGRRGLFQPCDAAALDSHGSAARCNGAADRNHHEHMLERDRDAILESGAVEAALARARQQVMEARGVLADAPFPERVGCLRHLTDGLDAALCFIGTRLRHRR